MKYHTVQFQKAASGSKGYNKLRPRKAMKKETLCGWERKRVESLQPSCSNIKRINKFRKFHFKPTVR